MSPDINPDINAEFRPRLEHKPKRSAFSQRLRALFLPAPLLLLALPGCGPQPQEQQPSPTPRVIVVTATPDTASRVEIPATSTPEPATATPAPVQETLFQTWGVYRGALFRRSIQSEGQIVITPLPTGDIFIFSHRINRDCPDNSTQFSYGGLLVKASSRRAERGFSQTDAFSNVYNVGVIRPGLLGGNVVFRDDIPVAGQPTCKGATLSFQAELQGNGRPVLGVELAAAKKAVSGGDNAPERMIKLAEDLCNCTIPPEPK